MLLKISFFLLLTKIPIFTSSEDSIAQPLDLLVKLVLMKPLIFLGKFISLKVRRMPKKKKRENVGDYTGYVNNT